MYSINGIKNETYTIKSSEEVTLPNTRARLIENGWEPRTYVMERVIAGTRKKAQTIVCHKSATGDRFRSVI